MVKTYRYLRGGLVVVVLFLVVAITKSAIDNRCFQTSISAYYYTTVRAVFVGLLMILGFGLIVLRGHTSAEDVLLNIAGMFAPVVAIMPTTDVGTCALTRPNVDTVVNGKLADWVVANVNNNLWALMITGLVGVAATGVIGSIAVYVGKRRGGPGNTLTPGTGRGLAIATALIVAAMVLYGFAPEWTRAHAHGSSAFAMFVLFFVIALINSFPHYTSRRKFRRIYGVIAILMVVVGLICYSILRNLDYQTLVLEASEILLFALYWAVQTVEHWDEATPRTDGSGRNPMKQPTDLHLLRSLGLGLPSRGRRRDAASGPAEE